MLPIRFTSITYRPCSVYTYLSDQEVHSSRLYVFFAGHLELYRPPVNNPWPPELPLEPASSIMVPVSSLDFGALWVEQTSGHTRDDQEPEG